MRFLLNAIQSPIFWQDENSVIIDLNSKFSSLINIPKKELYGKKPQDLASNQSACDIFAYLKKYQENRSKYHIFRCINKDKIKKNISYKTKKIL